MFRLEGRGKKKRVLFFFVGAQQLERFSFVSSFRSFILFFFWVGSIVFCRLTDPKKATELFFVSFFWVFVVFLGGGGEMGSTDAMG